METLSALRLFVAQQVRCLFPTPCLTPTCYSTPPPPPCADTYVNCSVAVDDNNSAKIIYRCNPGSKLDHKNATVGWVYRKVRRWSRCMPRLLSTSQPAPVFAACQALFASWHLLSQFPKQTWSNPLQDDIELEPRFNLGTESLSAGVTWKVGKQTMLGIARPPQPSQQPC